MAPAPPRFTLPRSARIRSRSDFQRVFRQRQRASDARVTMYILETGRSWTRLGISASRRIGNAVRRNRWKRLIREAFRSIRRGLPAGLDIVIVPKPGPPPTVTQLQRSIGRLLRRMLPDADISVRTDTSDITTASRRHSGNPG